MNVESLSEYRSRPKGWSYTDSDEFADSDRDELPDAPNVTKSNAPMLIVVACVAFPLLLALVIHLVRVSLS
jgi:hypothetical protein